MNLGYRSAVTGERQRRVSDPRTDVFNPLIRWSLVCTAARLFYCQSALPLAGAAVNQKLVYLAVVPVDDITAACLMTSLVLCGVDTVQQRDDGRRQSGNQPVRPPTARERDS